MNHFFQSSLVSGSSSGLGAYLHRLLGSDAYIRKNVPSVPKKQYDYVIHCGFGRPDQYSSNTDYIDSQLHIFHDLLSRCNRKFIFISSIDVLGDSTESTNAYAYTKSIIESELSTLPINYLIIRPGLLFGSGMRHNQLLRLCIEDKPKLSLSPSSTLSIVFYDQVLDCLYNDECGIVNLINLPLLSLLEVSQIFKSNPHWGSYIYNTPNSFVNSVPINHRYSINPLSRLRLFVESRSYE